MFNEVVWHIHLPPFSGVPNYFEFEFKKIMSQQQNIMPILPYLYFTFTNFTFSEILRYFSATLFVIQQFRMFFCTCAILFTSYQPDSAGGILNFWHWIGLLFLLADSSMDIQLVWGCPQPLYPSHHCCSSLRHQVPEIQPPGNLHCVLFFWRI